MSASAVLEREAWLAERQSYLGGSDAAAILGVHPYKSPVSVWLEKKESRQTEDNPKMWFGRTFESVIAERYMETHPEIRLLPAQLVRHSEHPFIGGNPDRLIQNRPAICEIKTVGTSTRKEWGVVGTDQVPRHYLIQGVHYCCLTNTDSALYLRYDRDECEIDEFMVWRDMELESMILTRLVAWWNKHILGDEPPLAGSDRDTTQYLTAKYPNTSGLVVAADEAITQELLQLCEKKAAKDLIDSAVKLHENRIKLYMGEAGELAHFLDPTAPVTWKNVNASAKTDWQSVAQGLICYCGLLPQEAAELVRAEANRLLELYTVPAGLGERRFSVPRQLWKTKK